MSTDDEIIFALLAGIATHPYIKDPPVFHPLNRTSDGKPEQVKIAKLRAYAGLELIDLQGITLSVYPTPRSSGTGVSHTSTWSSVNLGNTNPGEYIEKGLMNISIELRYFDPAFDDRKPVFVDISNRYANTTWHGSQITYLNQDKSEVFNEQIQEYMQRAQVIAPDDKQLFDTSLNKLSFGIAILPAEEILKQYTTLMRHVIRDLKVLNPLNVRNLTIKTIDYETSEIFNKSTSENLIFHKSRIGIEVEIYETNAARPELPIISSYTIAEQF